MVASNCLLFGITYTKADALLGMPNLSNHSGATLRSKKSTNEGADFVRSSCIFWYFGDTKFMRQAQVLVRVRATFFLTSDVCFSSLYDRI